MSGLEDENSTSPAPKRRRIENLDNDLSVEGHSVLVNGVLVELPVKPYSSQLSVMNAVVKGCNQKVNSLVESPTGSGKTLALLCATLAWQNDYITKLKFIANSTACSEFNDEKLKGNTIYESLRKTSKSNLHAKVPRIYYGTRTHRQIDQVIREFKKTSYKYKNMTILSSREHSCIYEKQGGNKSKTEICSELLDLKKRKANCPYFEKAYKFNSNESLKELDFHTPWDIEDILKFGKTHSACPYFGARKLLEEAEIIFCPYNYILDPNIREIMNINVNEEIVVIDEAHNIEDICRNIASKEFRADQIEQVIDDLKLVGGITSCDNIYISSVDRQKMENYQIIVGCLESISTFIEMQILKTTQDVACISWTGEELWKLLRNEVFNFIDFSDFQESCSSVIREYTVSKEDISTENYGDKIRPEYSSNLDDTISNRTKTFLENLVSSLTWIKTTEFHLDFQCCVLESFQSKVMEKDYNGKWKFTSESKRIRTLSFMCMSSAVIFKQISNAARSVILASGTLSPLSTFKSELGVQFGCEVQANHVIKREQVYVRGISNSLSGYPLNGKYSNTNLSCFQNELGDLILKVSQLVPHGILCFFSSYTMLKKQLQSWFYTGNYKKLSDIKHIFEEPQDSKTMDDIMLQYKLKIKESSDGLANGKTGAILFAVFRGKVAEGIDFADNEARCVIAVGIPYASTKDPVVSLKMKYNDTYGKTKGLLKGQDWYVVQAFRSFNQALGRCIRHKDDWGIILLVDDRISSKTDNLPKWVRAVQQSSKDYNLLDELKNFIETNLKNYI